MNLLNKDDIEQKVIALVSEKSTTTDTVALNATVHELGLDELDLIEIVLELEDTFSCQIDDAKFEQLETVADIIEYVYGICKK